jgi:hypothetical protein
VPCNAGGKELVQSVAGSSNGDVRGER